MQNIDKFKKENSISEVGVFKSLSDEAALQKLIDIPCESMNELKEECEFAKYEFKLFETMFKPFESLLYLFMYLALYFYVFSAIFYCTNPARKK